MGTWSEAILGNDTSCEVRERFFELYDNGENPENIADIVLNEQQENLEYDRTNVWIGLALACWECKVLTEEILSEIRKLVETCEDITFCKELDADSKFLKKRKKVLNDFLIKISKEKDKPRLRKKIPKQVASIYSAGMCCTYQNLHKKYIGVYITKSEHFRNRGEIEFYFLSLETETFPTLEMFADSTLHIEKLDDCWGKYEYRGMATGISYEKDEKESFYKNIPQVLQIVGNIKAPDLERLINNYQGKYIDFSKPNNIITKLEEIRMEMEPAPEMLEMTLSQLLDKIGVVD